MAEEARLLLHCASGQQGRAARCQRSAFALPAGLLLHASGRATVAEAWLSVQTLEATVVSLWVLESLLPYLQRLVC